MAEKKTKPPEKYVGMIVTKHCSIKFRDTDLWGFSCALTEGLTNGYFKENKKWAEAWKNNIDELRFGKEKDAQP
jgi:hypothetical protein